MKKLKTLLIVLTIFGSFLLANAQTEKENIKAEKENPKIKKGAILLGGSSSLDFTSLKFKLKTDTDSRDINKTTNIDFSPKIGFFVANNLAFGLELPIEYSSEKSESNDEKHTSSSFAFAPFVRKYFGGSNIKPYLEGQIGFGFVESEFTIPTLFVGSAFTGESSGNLFLYEIEGGIGIFFNEKVSLDLALGYAHSSIEFDDDDTKTIVNGFGFGVGIIIIL